MSTQMRQFVLGPGRGTRVRNPVGGDLVFKLEGSQCGDATNVLETEAAPGGGPPLHFHETQDAWLRRWHSRTRCPRPPTSDPDVVSWLGRVAL
jgi:hypothetical protein